MGTFRFKRFGVTNERSAMKVNTDGVLLGAAMTIRPSDRRFLDIGTGTGTIAMMCAQRMSDILGNGAAGNIGEITIYAIDVDEPSAAEAADNFAVSPWAGSLRAIHKSLDDFSASSDVTFDMIFSNPPYFEDSLLAPDERKSNARHTANGLSYREILDFAATRLSEDGRVAFVLPAQQEDSLCRHARMDGLHLFRILRIRTVPRKAPGRIVAEFSRHRCASPQEELLTIQNEGKYTEEYLSLTREFYLFA